MAEEKLKEIHSKLQLMFGSLDDELPEQTMSVMFIQPNSVVPLLEKEAWLDAIE
jgi:hypothetical protein